jgi:hypothetical protein
LSFQHGHSSASVVEEIALCRAEDHRDLHALAATVAPRAARRDEGENVSRGESGWQRIASEQDWLRIVEIVERTFQKKLMP